MAIDPDSVHCSISHKTARAAMVDVAAGDSAPTFTKKKLQTKTDSKFRSEHSLMMGYAYATTVLAAQFNGRSLPHNLVSYGGSHHHQ